MRQLHQVGGSIKSGSDIRWSFGKDQKNTIQSDKV